MALAFDTPFQTSDPEKAPLVLAPAELRQLWHSYYELLELHHAEVVDEQFEDAHRLFVEEVLPLRQILKGRASVVVDPRAQLTY